VTIGAIDFAQLEQNNAAHESKMKQAWQACLAERAKAHGLTSVLARVLQFRTSQPFYSEAEAPIKEADISMTQEALSSLQALGEQLRVRLLELPEYRALTVIDRTILELSQILNQPMTTSPNPSTRQATVEESPNGFSATTGGVQQRAEMAPSVAGSSQSRMATAIAESIAARTASLNAPAGTAPRFSHTLSAAS
jgi:hypothetical protein